MTLETITGNLLAYKKLVLGSFQHVDQLTTERRTNPRLRNQWFYTADGELYTVQKKGHLWAITLEPQNLVLQNIDEAYRQLTGSDNYFPEAEAGRASLEHEDTIVVDLEGLKLIKDNDQNGHFVVDPKAVNKLNSEQRKAAQRIYGSDEENFGLNMEVFAKARKIPYVFVLMPDYVQGTLRSNDKEFLGRASWLLNFNYNSSFNAKVRYVNYHDALRGVRQLSEASVNSEPQASSVRVEIPFWSVVTVPSSDSEISSYERNQRLAARSNAQRGADTQTYQPPKLEAGRFSDLEFHALEEVKTEPASSENSLINIKDFFDESSQPRENKSASKRIVYDRFSGLDLD